MLFFFLCIAVLIIGYIFYGKFIERCFVIDPDKITPATTKYDGVDYLHLPTWKIFLIQLLNIAGIGPIFGPILGALYGPIALLWIVLGGIFAGAVHDFFSGMLSLRKDGKNLPDIIGDTLGISARQIMVFFSLLLLILVGTVFVTAPATLIETLLTRYGFSPSIWLIIACIFFYYFLATMLPIDKIIGRFYPFFGALLLFMTFGVAIALLCSNHQILPHLNFFHNYYPGADKLPIWPLIFITISCSSISGFHSTQSPLMARCMKSEKQGRLIFSGSMIAESIIGLIWCTVGLSFYKSPEALLAAGNPAQVVNDISLALLGNVGDFLAILGVIILPITSGDTAFRSARLIIADTFKLSQSKIPKRLIIAIPIFLIGIVLAIAGQKNFQIIWRYFGWANQTLAMLLLWSAATYQARAGRNHWIASIPALFMSAVCFTFILYADIGFNVPYNISVILGLLISVSLYIIFLKKT
ncbi:MAG: carbon starvation protein A [Desulfobacteraceae bacterium]|nr:carbon starvation protein A [Desulfobacteraceae bacterium]